MKAPKERVRVRTGRERETNLLQSLTLIGRDHRDDEASVSTKGSMVLARVKRTDHVPMTMTPNVSNRQRRPRSSGSLKEEVMANHPEKERVKKTLKEKVRKGKAKEMPVKAKEKGKVRARMILRRMKILHWQPSERRA